jgi:hypothetical protein
LKLVKIIPSLLHLPTVVSHGCVWVISTGRFVMFSGIYFSSFFFSFERSREFLGSKFDVRTHTHTHTRTHGARAHTHTHYFGQVPTRRPVIDGLCYLVVRLCHVLCCCVWVCLDRILSSNEAEGRCAWKTRKCGAPSHRRSAPRLHANK